jgi:hypothetical protein
MKTSADMRSVRVATLVLAVFSVLGCTGPRIRRFAAYL